MFALFLMLQLAATVAPADPFAFFAPQATLDAVDRRHLDAGEPVAHVLSAQGREVGVFAAVPVNVDVDADRLIAWMRRIEALKKSEYVLAIRRFSDPPQLEDLKTLSLEDDELTDLRACRPGSCDVKLSAHEMRALQKVADAAGANWKPAMQDAFRRAVLARVQAYLASGRVDAYEDNDTPVHPDERFNALLDHSGFLVTKMPEFARYLRGFPQAAMPGVESFMYWSKEKLAGKPIVSVTHVSIVRGHRPGDPDVVVAGKGIFATHYISASLGLTTIVRDKRSGRDYLAYINRSEVDALGGVLSGVIRFFMQRRLKEDAAIVLSGLRRRLEKGEPES